MIAATTSKHLSFMCQGDIRPRAAAGSSRNGTTQAMASTACNVFIIYICLGISILA